MVVQSFGRYRHEVFFKILGWRPYAKKEISATPEASGRNGVSTSMTADLELTAPLPPKTKMLRYLFALILSGLAIYFFLSRFAAMGQV
jgi:hypothetical protein